MPIIAPKKKSTRKVTMKYTIGPASVASKASPKLAFPPVIALPANQTGIETTIQRTKKLMIVKTILGTVNSKTKQKPQMVYQAPIYKRVLIGKLLFLTVHILSACIDFIEFLESKKYGEIA